MRFSARSLLTLSGLLWIGIGMMLLSLGIRFLTEATDLRAAAMLPKLVLYTGSVEQAMLILVAFALAIGHFKAKFVLAKTVRRTVTRVAAEKDPTLATLFTPATIVLMAGMMSLGMLMNFLGVPLDVRGTIDIAVGAALVNGAVQTFQAAYWQEAK